MTYMEDVIAAHAFVKDARAQLRAWEESRDVAMAEAVRKGNSYSKIALALDMDINEVQERVEATKAFERVHALMHLDGCSKTFPLGKVPLGCDVRGPHTEHVWTDESGQQKVVWTDEMYRLLDQIKNDEAQGDHDA
jgi:hypothetical protein